jgi:hypothetical protein
MSAAFLHMLLLDKLLRSNPLQQLMCMDEVQQTHCGQHKIDDQQRSAASSVVLLLARCCLCCSWEAAAQQPYASTHRCCTGVYLPYIVAITH